MPRVAKKAKGSQVDLGPLFQLKDLPSIPHPSKPLLICVRALLRRRSRVGCDA